MSGGSSKRRPIYTAGLIAVHPVEAAAMLGLTETIIYDLINEGELAVIRCGRHVRIRVSELERWAEEQETRQQGGESWRNVAPRVKAPFTRGRTDDGARS